MTHNMGYSGLSLRRGFIMDLHSDLSQIFLNLPELLFVHQDLGRVGSGDLWLISMGL